MKQFTSLLKADLKRAVLSNQFLFTLLFILLVMLISCSGFMRNKPDTIYLLGPALGGGGSGIFILCIAPILPYGMSFATDTEDKASSFWVIRAGTTEYAAGKFIASAVGGFLSVAVGIVAFSLIMSAFFPLYAGNSQTGDSYAALLQNNEPVLYILAIAVHYALSAALFAGTAMAVSSFIPNKFCALATPVVIYFVLMLITTYAPIPDFLKVSRLVQDIYPDVSPLAAFLYKLIPVAAVLAVLFYITVRRIKTRMLAS